MYRRSPLLLCAVLSLGAPIAAVAGVAPPQPTFGADPLAPSAPRRR